MSEYTPGINFASPFVSLWFANVDLDRGAPGAEAEDISVRMANPRRRSNSSSIAQFDMKTKFEINEHEATLDDMPLVEEDDNNHITTVQTQNTDSSTASTISEAHSVDEEHS
jgi:hypothetical protein